MDHNFNPVLESRCIKTMQLARISGYFATTTVFLIIFIECSENALVGKL